MKVYRFNAIPKGKTAYIGGKAKNLLRLTQKGFNVPEWWVIPSDSTFSFFLDKGAEMRKLLALPERESSERIKEFILSEMKIDSEVSDTLKRIDFPVSIRSSAMNEDAETHSFAGQFDSFLNISADHESFIKKCIASIFNERNLMYHRMNGIDVLSERMAVIIQRMIFADYSGVCFTNDPVTESSRVIINAAYGLGEGVVSDSADADTYICSREGMPLKKSIGTKKVKIDASKNNSTEQREVASKLASEQVLSDEKIKLLTLECLNIEKEFGSPQDVEFAFCRETLFILQARPITFRDPKPLTWDNSNIVESFSGPTTPLTFSFAVKAYTTIYKMVMQNLGVRKDVIAENSMIFSNMIGFVNKKIYYSLESWFRTLSFLPAYNENKAFMETMMGVKDTYREKKKFNFRGYLELLKVTTKILAAYINHEKNIKKFMANYEESLLIFNSMMEEKETAENRAEAYSFLEKRLLYSWTIPINNDIFTMIFYGSLQKFMKRFPDLDRERTFNGLLSGEGDIESAKVAYTIWEIAEAIRNSKTALDAINTLNDEQFVKKLKNDKMLLPISEKFDGFLKKYGNRSVNELKLEVENIADSPHKIVQLIRQYANSGEFDSKLILERERDIRREAQKRVTKKILDEPVYKRISDYAVFNYLLRNARRFVRNRENLRFCRTNVFGAAKRIFRSIGRIFFEKGILSSENDIFYLTVDEIFSIIYGTSVTQNVKGLVELRKKDQEEHAGRDLPERFRTGYIPYNDLENTFEDFTEEDASGLGCSPGSVTGVIQKVINPYETKIEGDIMVAEKTDPGWLPIFPLFKAIIIERGSMLSHSAIVARELGIPAIVGVRNAMKTFKDGDVVMMNGSSGSIKMMKKAEEETNGRI